MDWHVKTSHIQLAWRWLLLKTNHVILPWKMFLIRSITCRAVYSTLMLCVMVNITALCRKFLKKSRHFTVEDGKFKLRTLINKIVWWKGAATNGKNSHSKWCSSSPVTSSSLCSPGSTQSPGIHWTNNDFPNPAEMIITLKRHLWIDFTTVDTDWSNKSKWQRKTSSD